ncbi:HAD-like protein [Fistulina hepatica ATCC 64428]|nr:HAD-like protein [Fistulina hepatica ATCC 64428]
MHTIHVDAILFDMDGTLIDSTAGINGAWEVFRETYPFIDLDKVLRASHGVRTVDNLRIHCRLVDPVEIEKEAKRFESIIIPSSTLNGRRGIILLPGVVELMEELAPVRALPRPLWAIVTSATREYADVAVVAAKLPIPDVFVRSDDVARGKPFPDPYLLGAEKCGVKPENCVVFEDAPPGVLSGKAAGCKTIGLLTTHSLEAVKAAQPDFIIRDLSR